MGVIIELARARQRIRELETKVTELELQIPKPIMPVTDLVMISRNEYIAEMRKVGIGIISLTDPLDATYSLTSKSELDNMAPYLVYPADLYIAQIWDCEDYGLQAQCDAGCKFHVSGVRLTLGDMPLGYHGFVFAMDKELNKWWLEPNAGFEYAGIWHQISEGDYHPKRLLI